MSLPVSAILLMAVFGIPRFDPGTAGESGWQRAKNMLAPLFAETSANPAQNDPFAAPGNSPQDSESRFPGDNAPSWDGGSAPEAGGDRPGAWPFSTPGQEHARSGPGTEPRVADNGGAAQRGPRGGDPVSRGPATINWTQARRKLAELGIDRFHLEAGLEPDQFLFVCLFSPDGDSRVTQRFEAEAVDPLVAVEQVLTQIDGWLANRYAEDTRSRLAPAR
jgi:hypothetical protein